MNQPFRQDPPPFDPHDPSPRFLLWAYRHGVFPMADPLSDRIEWFCPDPRALIPLGDRFHVRKSLERRVRKRPFDITTDRAFEEVIAACAAPRTYESLSWIDDRIIRRYVELHRLGHAHSVEAWLDGKLVGGLYGVHVGAAFFGESMFVRPELGGTDASKICLVHLVHHLRSRSFRLLDTQFSNQHLEQFGCVEIPAAEYLERLAEAIDQPVIWQPFEPAAHRV